MFAAMDHLFFSFDLNLCKPDSSIYLTALDKMGWKASETLFLDDSLSNIEGAQALGIQTLWVEKPELFEQFSNNMIRAHQL